MAELVQKPARARRLKPVVMIGMALLIFISLTIWGGTPDEHHLTAFIAGVALLIAAMLAYGAAVWHLLFQPLPSGLRLQETARLKAGSRRLLAVLVAIGGLSLVVGGFWDEVWHRQYGLPFGQDLLWRPHLLIYAGLLTPAGLAVASLATILKKRRGTLQQRFRADPVLGWLGLVGGLMFLAVPADPVWHIIYGEDISAWSLPHIVLLFSVSGVMFLAAVILLSSVPPKPWGSVFRISLPEYLVIFVFSFALLLQMQVLATDWENGNRLLSNRPEWLLPAIFAALAAFTGTAANQALRSYGAATLIGIIALCIRFSLIQAFQFDQVSVNTWIPILPPLVSLDLWYGYRVLARKGPAAAPWNALAAMAGMWLVSLAWINRTFDYPQIDGSNLIAVSLAGWAIAVGASWMGQTTGDYLATGNKQLEEVEQPNRLFRWVSPAAFAAAVAFIIFFIFTASPPG